MRVSLRITHFYCMEVEVEVEVGSHINSHGGGVVDVFLSAEPHD